MTWAWMADSIYDLITGMLLLVMFAVMLSMAMDLTKR
jgi:hypothetical protein